MSIKYQCGCIMLDIGAAIPDFCPTHGVGRVVDKEPAPTPATETPRISCPKCKEQMTTTPVCGKCGILPLAEGTFERLERDLAASQRRCERLEKARKIDMFALAKELGPKISLNFNEWKLIARAVEAQLNKETT